MNNKTNLNKKNNSLLGFLLTIFFALIANFSYGQLAKENFDVGIPAD